MDNIKEKNTEQSIKVVVFDCFGVVFKDRYKEFLKDNETALSNYIKNNSMPKELLYTPEIWNYPEYFNYLSSMIDVNKITDKEYYQIFSTASGKTVTEIQNQFRDTSCINKDIIDLIIKLKASKYKIAMIATIERKFLDKFLQVKIIDENYSQVGELFDFIRTSSEVKSQDKTSKEMMEIICKELKTTPDKLLVIDDSAKSVAKFKQLEIKSLQFINIHNLKQNLVKFNLIN